MANRTYPQTQLDIAWQIQEDYAAILERRKANRELLRNIRISDPEAFTEEEAAQIDGQLYPPRKRGEDEAEAESGEPDEVLE